MTIKIKSFVKKYNILIQEICFITGIIGLTTLWLIWMVYAFDYIYITYPSWTLLLTAATFYYIIGGYVMMLLETKWLIERGLKQGWEAV